MDGLDEFHQHERVIEDFVTNTLANVSGDLGRLVYVATLRDLATGRYHHDGLERIYSDAAVHEALRLCHEELLDRILESPLEDQEAELMKCLKGFEGPPLEIAASWREHQLYRFLVPSGVPPYLKDLFYSNINVLLSLILEEQPTQQSVA
jgi:hypothetical protein